MSGAGRYAADLTMIRLTPGARPGETTRVEHVARAGLAREVLVDRALPLLARARRVLDEIADPTHGAPAPAWAQLRAATVAGAIADLIGHSVTDQPAAPEIEAILADGTPCRLTWDAWQTLTEEARAQIPPDAQPIELVTRETAAEKARRHEQINEALDAMGIAVKIPLCPMGPYAESSEQPTPHVCQFCEVPLARHGEPCRPESSDPAAREKNQGEAPAGTAHALADTDPELITTLRKIADRWGALGVALTAAQLTDPAAVISRLTGGESSEPAAPTGEDSDCRRCGGAGCPACDARETHEHRWIGTHDRGPVCAECGTPKPGPDDEKAETFRQGWLAGEAAGRESREPAPPVEETREARALRLDRERHDAQRAYARAVQAADEAWRTIGGRP